MLFSATNKKSQPDADLHPVQNTEQLLLSSNKQERLARCWITSCEHAPVSNKQEMLVRCWLTSCVKPTACSCQQQEGKACWMLSYKLKTQGMLLSGISRKGQPGDLQAIQNPECALISNKQERPARCWLTSCSKPRVYSCQNWAGKASQMLNYILFNTLSCQK